MYHHLTSEKLLKFLQQITWMQKILRDQNHLKLLGVYHSHIGYPATPSEYDRVAAQPYFSYRYSFCRRKYRLKRCGRGL